MAGDSPYPSGEPAPSRSPVDIDKDRLEIDRAMRIGSVHESPLASKVRRAGEIEMQHLRERQAIESALTEKRTGRWIWRVWWSIKYSSLDAARRFKSAEPETAKNRIPKNRHWFWVQVEAMLKSPVTAMVATLVSLALALCGKLSMSASIVFVWVAAIIAVVGLWRSEPVHAMRPRSRILILLALAAGGYLGAIKLTAWMESKPPPNEGPQSKDKETPITVAQAFNSDFQLLAHNGEASVTIRHQNSHEVVIPIQYIVWDDFNSRSRFLSVYIPDQTKTFDALWAIPYIYTQITLSPLKNTTLHKDMPFPIGERIEVMAGENGIVKLRAKNPHDLEPEEITDFKFTGRVYLYFESDLSLRQLADLGDFYKANRLFPEFRGPAYAIAKWSELKQNRP